MGIIRSVLRNKNKNDCTIISNYSSIASPLYNICLVCGFRNYGMGENKIQIDKKVLSNQRSEFSIIVGKHKASVRKPNKQKKQNKKNNKKKHGGIIE